MLFAVATVAPYSAPRLHLWEYVLVASLFLLAAIAPGIGRQLFNRIETDAARLAKRPYAPMVLLFSLPILLRLLILPANPIPQPVIQDEFTHLFVADTLIHGRLANPPLRFAQHFESSYIIQEPTYTAAYPIGIGATLAVAKKLFGEPWIAVLLFSGIMPAAVFWALRHWTSSGWALLAATLVICNATVLSYWTNQYWGGSVAATIGAVIIGSVPMVLAQPTLWRVALLSFGLGALFTIRPVETVIFGVMVSLYAAFQLRGISARTLRTIALGVTIGVLPAAVLTTWHNYSATGNAFLFPYQVLRQQYGFPQPFVFQQAVSPTRVLNKAHRQDYKYQRAAHDARGMERLKFIASRSSKLYAFYIGPFLIIPLIIAILHWRGRGSRFALITIGVLFGEIFVYGFFFPHYPAAITAFVFLIVAMGFREMRRWTFRNRPVGEAFSRFLAAACIAMFACIYVLNGLRNHLPVMLEKRAYLWDKMEYNPHRLPYINALHAQGSRHIVFVKNEASSYGQWVANDADPADSPIIWVHSLGISADADVWHAYGEPVAWMLDCAEPHVRLLRYNLASIGGPLVENAQATIRTTMLRHK